MIPNFKISRATNMRNLYLDFSNIRDGNYHLKFDVIVENWLKHFKLLKKITIEFGYHFTQGRSIDTYQKASKRVSTCLDIRAIHGNSNEPLVYIDIVRNDFGGWHYLWTKGGIPGSQFGKLRRVNP